MTINRSKYQIRFFKVGEGVKGGDAILITLYDENDNEHLVLIDGGYQKTGIAIIEYIKAHYRNHVIDYVFNTPEDPLRSVKCVEQRCEFIRKNLEFMGR